MNMPLKCLFCEFSGTRDELIGHSAGCEAHPLSARLDATRAELAEARKDSARLAAVDKILWGKLDSRPIAPALSVYLNDDGAVCIQDDDYSPSQYSGTGSSFSSAIDAVMEAKCQS
jgi:hydroxymethylpyrimidine/phosphomethylpyrimidine kinase